MSAVGVHAAPLAGDLDVLPASFAQQRLWFLDQLDPDSAAYNIPQPTRLRGRLDLAALERALGLIVARHEPLRTTFTLLDGVPHQTIAPPAPVVVPVVDLVAQPDPEQAAVRLAHEEAAAPFDLATGPLLRASVSRLAADDHILMLTLHHIVADGWSIGILKRELAALYGAIVGGRAVGLPPLPIQYADYVAWQQDWLAGGGLDGQLAYWKRQHADGPAVLTLPADRPRPPRQSFRGAMVRDVFPPELLARIRALGEQERATLFMTLLTAYTALLARYSGQEDVVVASPFANRSRTELEGLIGLFVNTLALRTSVSGNPSFRELLGRVRRTALGAYSNQDLPFEKLVEELNPERHLSHAPVAQVLFALQNATEAPLGLPGLDHAAVPLERGTAKFDLAAFAVEGDAGLRVAFEYCTDLFEHATVQRMLGHFRTLLEAAVADPERPIWDLPLMSEAERHELVVRWNDTERPYPTERGVHYRVAEQARRTPAAVAVEDGAERLTYAELDAGSNRLARHLADVGVRSGDVVAVAAERGFDMVVAVLATLKAGAAYLPIDPHHPRERVAFMLADSACSTLVTQRHLAGALAMPERPTVVLDARPSRWRRLDGTDPGVRVGPGDLAYVIYTSGSTGTPKGVAMEHRPLANLLGWQLERWGTAAPARTLQFAALSFDVAFQELFSTWCAGGTLVLTDEETRRAPDALLAHIRERDIERLFLPFVALQQLAEAAQRLDLEAPSLREIITAGEQLKSTAAIRSFFARHPACALENQYGPTESHVVTAHRLQGPPERWPDLPPIGRPIGNARLYVLDRNRHPVPRGVPGELYIGGPQLARGYVGRPELTAERFLDDPFGGGGDDAARVYRTGDLARHRADGELECLGRTDDQVKVRGYRVELGEVEATLTQHPGLRAAAVAAPADAEGGRRLVAYVVPRAEPGPKPVELRAFLGERLPDYMVPAAFVALGSLPLGPTGKVDRRRLPAPNGEPASEPGVAPRDELERLLADLWRDALGLPRAPGIKDDFFALGGHSLLAVRLFSAIERTLKVRIPLATLFADPSIEHVAAAVRYAQGSGGRPGPTVVELRPGGGPPLFLCPWLTGEVLGYRGLVRALGGSCAVYGLQARGLDGKARPDTRIEEMAAHYLQEIRTVQPIGPYRLGGYCFGGTVAFELARQLESAGSEVELLALFDASPFGLTPDPERRQKELAYAHAFLHGDPRERIAVVRERLHNANVRVGLRVWYAGHRLYMHSGRALHPKFRDITLINRWAMRFHVSGRTTCRLTLFRVGGPAAGRSSWAALTDGGLEVIAVRSPGARHDTFMQEPHAAVVAAELTARIEELEAGRAGPAENPDGSGVRG